MRLNEYREADKDMVVGGYRVPKGTTLMLSPHPIHVSHANYLHPHKFWPERWVSEKVSEWNPEQSGGLMGICSVAAACDIHHNQSVVNTLH